MRAIVYGVIVCCFVTGGVMDLCDANYASAITVFLLAVANGVIFFGQGK